MSWGHDFGIEVARRVARHILFIEPRCCLSCKPEVPGQADYSSVTRMFLVFIECLSWGAGLCLECYGVVDVLYTCTDERTLTAVRCLTGRCSA